MTDLEKRVAELERLVKELIEYKQDKEVVKIDAEWNKGLEIHDYRMNENWELEEVVVYKD